MNNIITNLSDDLTPFINLDCLDIYSATRDYIVLRNDYWFYINPEKVEGCLVYIQKEEFQDLWLYWIDHKIKVYNEYKDDPDEYTHCVKFELIQDMEGDSIMYDDDGYDDGEDVAEYRSLFCSGPYIYTFKKV